jgi:hypothetical protein
MNRQSTHRIYYTRRRRFSQFMSHVVMASYIIGAIIFLGETYRIPSFAPIFILYIPIAVYTVSYCYALTDTCITISPSGIEYKRPEFSILASWSQLKSLKRNAVLSTLGLRYYLIVESPTVLYTKWFGTAYKFQLNHIFFPSWQKRIPLGKMWQAYEELEHEIHTRVPNLPFESAQGKAAG